MNNAKQYSYKVPCTSPNPSPSQVKANRMARLLFDYTGEAYDDRANVVDALTDIRHMCDATGIDYYAACSMAFQHYEQEKRGNIYG